MNRKDEHVSLAKAFHKTKYNAFDDVAVLHHSFPNTRIDDVSIETKLFDQTFSSPFFINAMTGGSKKTKEYNRQLAILAKETDLMMATGSVSAALKDDSVADSYRVIRQEFPTGCFVANVGAGTTLENAKRAVDLFDANALQIHLNAPQELVMPEGDRDFSHWLTTIEEIAHHLDVPVIVKEVGFGMTRETIQQLLSTGVTIIDVAGSGGTSFTQIENARRKKREFRYLDNFGISNVASLLEAKEVPVPFELIASGGIRNAYDIFKSLCFGAQTVGVAGTILNHLLTHGLDETIALVQQWQAELKTLYAMSGVTKTVQLKKLPLILSGEPKDWCAARHIDIQKYGMRK
ncbi:type 2 isopentenyl-diphosphate Delta-isomerase [Enterococcus saccharolyticus]|uniref:Isopentenyl-diphosphate delta-isomerase n=1 Tax=Candidatus Enterococcus willemsii TaxID=1857215 RepID=A0ABQ6Z267_9ENTE|nr:MULTISPECIES: type 2 isopentenyl-diphosphate Delta-isomerase [Enterococcus]KAF1305706.1 type 2 isopentenyl-diphosphate Delta-isomerase [Enterococcus sp. CU12B]MCD5001465.1 type 2 isopentenyl-diphosphate Delta-isomerase [Enterococcus saccharolyticus]